MNGIKKILVRILIILYGLSYFLQNTIFVDRKKVYAAENPTTTNLVAIFVDQKIYPGIKTNLERYTTTYIQGKIGNSKAVVFPIDTKTMKAHEISQMLENMYFEGLKNESSKLVGVILMGDVPLPVVQNNGFIYPSIYPYVDFEKQQFIYDTNKRFFVYNENPNGQAELWHGIIKFNEVSEYNKFFQKVKDYKNSPTTFIDKAIWYEDFIGLKKYFIPENTKYYVNNLTFAEDIGYHRYNNLMINMLQGEHNNSTLAVGNDLSNDLQDTEDPDLKAYATDMAARNSEALIVSQDVSSSMPTLTLKKATQEMLKGYDGLISSQFLSKIKDNIAGLARRYKSTEGETFTDYGSLTDKIAQKDNRLLGDADNNIQPLLIQMNDFLENKLNDKIEEEKYYMTIPIPLSKLEFEGNIKILPTFRLYGKPLPKCIRTKYNYYENYLFGRNANEIISSEQTNIYKGTFKNLTSTTDENISSKIGQSIGGSYDIFSTQVEANRGYDFSTTQEEISKYDTLKINKQEIWNKDCNFHLFGYCMRWKKTWKPDDSADEKKCYTDDVTKQGGCESMIQFSQRNRGGASPMNIDATTQKLKTYNYKDAKFPIYDIAGSKKIDTPQADANVYSGIKTYSALIQTRFAVNEEQEKKNKSIDDFINNPIANGIDLKFTNQIVSNTDLEHPNRAYNPPKTYADVDFFTLYPSYAAANKHKIYGGKAVLYNRIPGGMLNCSMQGQVYTYKTIDSRIKNISPTRDQISDTEFYKFKEASSLELFYNKVLIDLAATKADILDKDSEFSGTNSIDMTGVISNLTQIRRLIGSGNSGMTGIIAFPASSLGGYTPAQIVTLANERSGKNLTPEKITELSGRIEKTNEGLELLRNYIGSLSINNTLLSFESIIESEAFKNQKVEILSGWKANINQNLDYITANIIVLKNTFTTARGIYNNIFATPLQDTISGLTTKKNDINYQQQCGSIPTYSCGCTNNYQALCTVIQNLIDALTNANITDINDRIGEIQSYVGDNGQVQPFVEINQLFSPTNVASEITKTKAMMNTFDVSTDPDKKEKNKGMNLTTQDRPIDNIRNITFQGVGGDSVRFNYPNLYEVKIYQESGNKLILKEEDAIRDAIKSYLTGKAEEYNLLLNEQLQKRNQWYTSLSSQFNFIEELDPLANPNASVHNYSQNSIPEDYFITQIISFLDTLENGPDYGKKAIYGEVTSTTIDEKLDMIAKLFYYQNITWPERLKQTTVDNDMIEIKSSFDINQKINNVITTYLTKGNDQGKFITPVYNVTGYEIAYINSDGNDYVSAKPLPGFIQQIQSIQEKASTTKINITESTSSSDEMQDEVDSCEGVDTQGTALLFDFKTFKSPWIKAMGCWAKQILKKPFDIQIGFKNSLGPVIVGSSLKNIIQGITGAVEDISNDRKEYGSQRNPPDNEAVINGAQGDIKEKLQGYNNHALVDITKTIVSVDTTGNIQVQLDMAQNMGDINVKISGTGANCFAIDRKGTSLSNNICTKEAKEFYNPNTEQYVFDIIDNQHKAGVTTLKIQLCPAIGDLCITKQQIINIIPGPVKEITLNSPDGSNRVMEGGEIPLVIKAIDRYGNEVGQSIQPYTISVLSGNGKISDGASSNTSIKFDNFVKAGFIYQAPLGITENTGVTITVAPDQTIPLLGVNEGVVLGKIKTQNITVVKGIVTVFHTTDTIYKSTETISGQKITFTLPNDETDIQYQDSDGIGQIKAENVPSIRITVKDRNDSVLNTVANIVSKEGLVKIGTIKTKPKLKNSIYKLQTLFSPANSFVINDGTLDITLYPTFKAGNDIVTINIPGVDPIIIPITINPGAAKTVLLKLEKSRMDLTTTTGSKGTINVVDSRNNKVTSGTAIKLGVIGPAATNTNEFIYSGNEYTYTITTKKPGGEGYIFAYIKDKSLTGQIPGFERFIVQESVIPKSGLNVMYLNLFGTDRGNQRGYFSENNKTINNITNQSEKLLTTTTEIVDPNKIKQIEYIINPNGQTQSINIKVSTLIIDENKKFTILMPEIVKIHLDLSSTYKIQTFTDSGTISEFGKDSNTLLYIPEPTDSVITGNEATKTRITINGVDMIDLTKGIIDPAITITADNEMLQDMSTYTVTMNGKNLGKIMIWNNDNITTNTANIDIQDPITYGKTNIFSEGSTNTEGIGIYINASAFTKQGYQSIEDSSDGMLGIGFTNNFKNISNFANGKFVGEATLPYGSQFLINFGDPLLERREKNPNIPDTDFDASIGQTIYADPTKTIFKVLPIDFNSDGVKDLMVVYTDGVVKILKNYGGTEPYKDLQELMIIAEPIKEIKIGDVDGNGEEDMFIITNNDKGIVYLNDKGVFPVDGKNVCLNVKSEPGAKNSTPDDFSNIQQLFVQDMNQDGKLDIVTNDIYNDIKIFYGGSTNGGANYLSLINGACDSQRYERQKNNYTIIKRFGTKVNNNRYIQDASLVHRKGIETPQEGITEEVEAPDTSTPLPTNMSEAEQKALKNQALNDIKTMVANTDTYVAAGTKQLSYIDNPLSRAPLYESLSTTEITYLPINETNDAVSVYKQYADINGGVLRTNDEIMIKTTIISKKNNNKVTYIDELKGPRSIVKDSDNKIPSLVFTSGNTGGLIIDRNGPDGYQFVIDNILLDSGAALSFSYTVKYTQVTPSVKIDVQDQDLLPENKRKDSFPDITVNSTDSCIKSRRIIFNDKTTNKKTYEQVFDDIQGDINNYNSGAKTAQQTAIGSLIDKLANVESLENISELPGLTNLEARSPINLINSLSPDTLTNMVSPGGLSLNLNTSFIDNATAKVSKKLDTALQGLCQGFKIGKDGSCQGVPLPFNQAFLAPGDYHIFGCVPKLPNPLYSVFNTLNTTIGKGMPLLTFPGNRGPTVAGYLPFPGIFGFPFKGATDGFFLGMDGGTYPSQFRLYIAPTLTLGLGIAMCFGPYTVGKVLPKPFRDMGGNCIVFAVPPLTTCSTPAAAPVNQPTKESLGSSMIAAAGQGTCNNPPKIGNTIIFAGESNTNSNEVNTASSPLYLATANLPILGELPISAAESSENSVPYSAAIPQGNFGGLIAMDQDPIKVSANADYGNVAEETNYDGYNLEKGEKINLKIVGAKTKGLVKCVVQKWMTSQITYIQNNLTKMTIQVDLPDLSTAFQGFDKIGNLSETYQELNKQDTKAGYMGVSSANAIDLTPNTTGGTVERTKYLSKQQVNSISQQIGQNPFEAIQKIFSEVPLVNIDSKDVNVKIPSLTSDDIKKYQNYLTIRIQKNAQILEDWTNMLNQMLAMCGTTDKTEAKQTKTSLEIIQKTMLGEDSTLSAADKKSLVGWIDKEIKDMNQIIAATGGNTRQDMGADMKNIGTNATNTAIKIAKLPRWKIVQGGLLAQKAGALVSKKTSFTNDDQARLDAVNNVVNNLGKCASVVGSLDGFLSFKANTEGLINSIKENINVLEKYKEFPNQLYDRTHLTDRYLTEISSLLSDFVGTTTSWLGTNANRYSQYIDAIVLLVGTIKTRQAIIDFSINRSEKCSKCSNDNHGSFSCSLSFLCPKLPIFPIPAFKIPNIYMDMTHIELGMNIILPKINFIPTKIPLPQLPNLPEPPTIEVDWNILLGLDLNFFKGISLPTIPVIPEPPTLPEPPSFIPSIKINLPVLPPAPKIPKILPEISIVLNVAKFIGKVFCIVKGGIGLVGEKGVKGKIEQLTQRTWNVPIFDFFNLKFKETPLQGFDYKLDAYATLKFNFDGVYDVFNNIASITNNMVSKGIEAPIQKLMDNVTDTVNNNAIISGFNKIENFDQNININYNSTSEETGMIEYMVAYNELKQGLISFKNETVSDKTMNDRVKYILATVENKSTILPATDQIQQVGKTAQSIIDKTIKENKTTQKDIQDYDNFIKKIQNNKTVLVADKGISISLTTPLLTIDSPTKNILQSQEDPTKTYLTLNKNMVQGYLDAVNNDGPEKLNMSQTTYKNSKIYLETTKEKIDTALLAYNDTPLLAQSTCTDCTDAATENNNYSTDISAYVNGVFVESYSGDEKTFVNTMNSSEQIQNVQKTYTTNNDLNNDTLSDILMYDTNTIYVKYAKQESKHVSKGGNTLIIPNNTFYSHSIDSIKQLENDTDAYGYLTIKDITIKILDKNKEVKNFKTIGQSFDTLQLSWKNSKVLGEQVDGYVIKLNTKIDDKDTPSSFRDFLGIGERSKYIVVLPNDTDYTKALLTIDNTMVKEPINIALGESILVVEQYDPQKDKIEIILKDLPRKRLYTSIATLTNTPENLNNNQKQFTLYKKTSSRSNQTVAGMQNIGDIEGPVGEIVLWRNTTNEIISTGVAHEGYINTNYTLKSVRTDNVIVSKMIIQQDGITKVQIDNQSQTGMINLSGLFFTGTNQQSFDFIAIDQNNNITKEHVTLNIKIPDIEVIDLKKGGGGTTAEIIAKISNDLDTGMVIFQRLRNGVRNNISGSLQNSYGGFNLTPKQTIITGGVFTMGKDIGLYDTQGNEIAIINPETGEIKIKQGYENKIKIHLNFTTHIPVVELRDITKNITLFQIVLPIESISNIKMNEGKPNYEQLQLPDRDFGDFNNGYCIKNTKNDCILYTNTVGAIYIPGMYASSLVGEYIFDTTSKNTTFIIKDQANKAIVTLTLKIRASK